MDVGGDVVVDHSRAGAGRGFAMNAQPITTTAERQRPDDLRAEAQRLLREGMSGYDVATALNIAPDALRRLVGLDHCEDCT